MASPKKHDKLVKQLMSARKTEPSKAYNTSEESEFNALKYDLEHGIKLLPHKMNRYNELKEKLGK